MLKTVASVFSAPPSAMDANHSAQQWHFPVHVVRAALDSLLLIKGHVANCCNLVALQPFEIKYG